MQSVTYYFTFWKNVILFQLHITYNFIALFLSIVYIIALKIEFYKPSLTFFWHWKQVIMNTALNPTYIELLWHFNCYIHINIFSFETIRLCAYGKIISFYDDEHRILSISLPIQWYIDHFQFTIHVAPPITILHHSQ